MGRKSKPKSQVQPFCFYCDREFDDEKTLIMHQKAKHFKCHLCHKKMATTTALNTHMQQVHKEKLTKVPNAKEGRDSLEFEIFGMEGVPEEFLASEPSSKRQRVHGVEDGTEEDEGGTGHASGAASSGVGSAAGGGMVGHGYSGNHAYPGQPLPSGPMPAMMPYGMGMGGGMHQHGMHPGMGFGGHMPPGFPSFPGMQGMGMPPPGFMGGQPRPGMGLGMALGMGMPFPPGMGPRPFMAPPGMPGTLQSSIPTTLPTLHVPTALPSAGPGGMTSVSAVSAPPAPSTTSAPAPPPIPGQHLVYSDESFSAEESRAAHVRYAYNPAAREEELAELQAGLDARLAAILG